MVQSGLESLKGRHPGKLCIIAAPGPSLRHLSVEQGSKHLMISVNGAAMKFPNAEYFFTCDPAIRLQNTWEAVRASTSKIIIGVPESRGHGGFGAYDSKLNKPYAEGFDPQRFIHIYRHDYRGNLKFHPEDKTVVFGTSSVHCAAHVAYLMGCTPIVLVGCDCGPEDGKHYHYQFEGNGRYAEFIADGNYEKLFRRDYEIVPEFRNYWEQIGNDNPTVEFINCGNAVIPTIPRQKIEDVLRRYE